MNNKKGANLIAVMGIFFVVGIVSLGFISVASFATSSSAYKRKNVQAYYTAKSINENLAKTLVAKDDEALNNVVEVIKNEYEQNLENGVFEEIVYETNTTTLDKDHSVTNKFVLSGDGEVLDIITTANYYGHEDSYGTKLTKSHNDQTVPPPTGGEEEELPQQVGQGDFPTVPKTGEYVLTTRYGLDLTGSIIEGNVFTFSNSVGLNGNVRHKGGLFVANGQVNLYSGATTWADMIVGGEGTIMANGATINGSIISKNISITDDSTVSGNLFATGSALIQKASLNAVLKTMGKAEINGLVKFSDIAKVFAKQVTYNSWGSNTENETKHKVTIYSDGYDEGILGAKRQIELIERVGSSNPWGNSDMIWCNKVGFFPGAVQNSNVQWNSMPVGSDVVYVKAGNTSYEIPITHQNQDIWIYVENANQGKFDLANLKFKSINNPDHINTARVFLYVDNNMEITVSNSDLEIYTKFKDTAKTRVFIIAEKNNIMINMQSHSKLSAMIYATGSNTTVSQKTNSSIEGTVIANVFEGRNGGSLKYKPYWKKDSDNMPQYPIVPNIEYSKTISAEAVLSENWQVYEEGLKSEEDENWSFRILYHYRNN